MSSGGSAKLRAADFKSICPTGPLTVLGVEIRPISNTGTPYCDKVSPIGSARKRKFGSIYEAAVNEFSKIYRDSPLGNSTGKTYKDSPLNDAMNEQIDKRLLTWLEDLLNKKEETSTNNEPQRQEYAPLAQSAPPRRHGGRSWQGKRTEQSIVREASPQDLRRLPLLSSDLDHASLPTVYQPQEQYSSSRNTRTFQNFEEPAADISKPPYTDYSNFEWEVPEPKRHAATGHSLKTRADPYTGDWNLYQPAPVAPPPTEPPPPPPRAQPAQMNDRLWYDAQQNARQSQQKSRRENSYGTPLAQPQNNDYRYAQPSRAVYGAGEHAPSINADNRVPSVPVSNAPRYQMIDEIGRQYPKVHGAQPQSYNDDDLRDGIPQNNPPWNENLHSSYFDSNDRNSYREHDSERTQIPQNSNSYHHQLQYGGNNQKYERQAIFEETSRVSPSNFVSQNRVQARKLAPNGTPYDTHKQRSTGYTQNTAPRVPDIYNGDSLGMEYRQRNIGLRPKTPIANTNQVDLHSPIYIQPDSESYVGQNIGAEYGPGHDIQTSPSDRNQARLYGQESVQPFHDPYVSSPDYRKNLSPSAPNIHSNRATEYEQKMAPQSHDAFTSRVQPQKLGLLGSKIQDSYSPVYSPASEAAAQVGYRNRSSSFRESYVPSPPNTYDDVPPSLNPYSPSLGYHEALSHDSFELSHFDKYALKPPQLLHSHAPPLPDTYKPQSSKNYAHSSPESYSLKLSNGYRSQPPEIYEPSSPDRYVHPSPHSHASKLANGHAPSFQDRYKWPDDNAQRYSSTYDAKRRIHGQDSAPYTHDFHATRSTVHSRGSSSTVGGTYAAPYDEDVAPPAPDINEARAVAQYLNPTTSDHYSQPETEYDHRATEYEHQPYDSEWDDLEKEIRSWESGKHHSRREPEIHRSEYQEATNSHSEKDYYSNNKHDEYYEPSDTAFPTRQAALKVIVKEETKKDIGLKSKYDLGSFGQKGNINTDLRTFGRDVNSNSDLGLVGEKDNINLHLATFGQKVNENPNLQNFGEKVNKNLDLGKINHKFNSNPDFQLSSQQINSNPDSQTFGQKVNNSPDLGTFDQQINNNDNLGTSDQKVNNEDNLGTSNQKVNSDLLGNIFGHTINNIKDEDKGPVEAILRCENGNLGMAYERDKETDYEMVVASGVFSIVCGLDCFLR